MATAKTQALYDVHPGVAMVQKWVGERLAKKDRITHRIELTSPAQIDAEVKKWLKTAYDLDV
jgi:Domain of unknown function (DUF5655)